MGANRVHSVQWLGCRLDNHGIMVHFLTGTRYFCLFQSVHTCCGAHSASCLIGNHNFFPGGSSGQCIKLTTTLHLMLWLGMSGAKPPVPCLPSWHAQGQLYLYLLPYKLNFFKIQFTVWLSGVSNCIKSSWCGYLQCYGPARCHGHTICGSGKYSSIA